MEGQSMCDSGGTCCLHGAGCNDFDRSNIHHKAIGRVGPEMASAFGTKKVEIFRAHPSNGQSNEFACIKIIKSSAKLRNSYIGNFMYVSFRAQPINGPPSPSCRGLY